MLYRPARELRMWDTWMLREGDEYHLFTLSHPYDKLWDRVCHAVTRDWINWRECPDIMLEGAGGQWDERCILTGSVFRADGRYCMTYGANDNGVQKIGLIFSDDLYRWEKYPGNPVLSAREPHYRKRVADTPENNLAWRDAYVVNNGDYYEAFICAEDFSKPKTVNGCVAYATSKDLISWEYHSPVASPGRYIDMEVPQYFELNGFHYLLFSTSGNQKQLYLPSRHRVTGTFYLVSRGKHGPYGVPEDNLLIGSGEGRVDCYVAKVIDTGEGLLLYHHICGYRTAFAFPKEVRQNSDGTLFLERWRGVDKLRGEKRIGPGSTGRVLKASKIYPVGSWTPAGNILTCNAGPALSGWCFDSVIGDFCAEFSLDISGAARAGVFFRVQDGDTSHEKGWALSLDRERSRIELCRSTPEGRVSLCLVPLDAIYGDVPAKSLIEVFMRDSYIEIYVNRRPCFVLNASMVTASDHLKEGKLGFFAEGGTARFSDFCVYGISADKF